MIRSFAKQYTTKREHTWKKIDQKLYHLIIIYKYPKDLTIFDALIFNKRKYCFKSTRSIIGTLKGC